MKDPTTLPQDLKDVGFNAATRGQSVPWERVNASSETPAQADSFSQEISDSYGVPITYKGGVIIRGDE
jgi:hypothetical protein